jgi:beta-lactamase regulating signal transducer with metallopeptidase domain
MSITASYIIGFILLFRLLFGKRFPRLFTYALWGIVLIRLALPFSIESVFSIFNVIHTPGVSNTEVAEYLLPSIGPGEQPQMDMGSTVIDNPPSPAPVTPVNQMQIIIPIAMWVWIAGASVLILAYLISYITLRMKLSTATLYKNHKGIYQSDKIMSPALAGILKPRIVFPHNIEKVCTESEIELIGAHERIHIRHFDHIIKPFSVLLLCVYWFNPLIWLAFYISNKDREFACDESVVNLLGEDVRKEYATSLLKISTYQNNIFSAPAFGESNIKARITSIVNYKKPAARIGAVAAVVIILVGVVCLTNAKNVNLPVNEKELFKDYGWTVDYLIGSRTDKLSNLRELPTFAPHPYYYAYHNELSKDIGLGMEGFANREIDVEIYKIKESMPAEFYPIQDARGVVIKADSKIIGAYISVGRHSTFNACSLRGNSFEKTTGLSFNKWLEGKIAADNQEERLAELQPEQVMLEYFNALKHEDQKSALSCLSKQTLLDGLSANMQDDVLFNEFIDLPLTNSEIGAKTAFSNLKSVNVVQIKPLGINDTAKEGKRFRIVVDLQYKQDISIGSGRQSWDCTMVYETPQTGWKIDGFGHA